MRLQKIRSYYSHYLDRFYAARPGLADASFRAQFRELMDDCFGASDYWSKALAPHGYEIFESISNAAPLQRKWAAENGCATESPNEQSLLELTARQVKQFRPEVLFVVDYSTFSRAFLDQLRADNPSVRCVVGWCGAAYSDPTVFRAFDLILSCVPELVAEFRALGHVAHHLDHAFAPQILQKIDATRAPNIPFSFLGSIVKAKGFHNERERLLLDLTDSTELEIWADLPAQESLERERRPWWKRRRPTLASRAHPALWGRAMYQQLHDSRISLNTHIDISPVSASNMRLFEATGAGSCLLTDWRANLPDLFEPETEVVTYRNSAECAERVAYLLAHESERQAIAAAGQRRTLRDHTYTRWAAKFDRIVRTALA